MTIDQSGQLPEEASELSRQAKEWVFLDKTSSDLPPTAEEVQRLVHELQVHQLELEMQNEQLRQARDELESANLDLDAFNYSVAHDLRLYLTTISSYCQFIQGLSSTERAEQSLEYLEKIYQGTQSMDRLIDTLLDFSRVAKEEVRRQSVDLSSIATSLVAEQILAVDEFRGTFRIAPDIQVDADPDLLRMVLDNLIGNACKYAGNREGAVIEFGETSVDGKRVCFVRDNGPGFDMALADRLFLPFQRLPGTVIKGHGIGLATVERIIRRHSGRVWAESEPGKGAIFLFTLD